MTRLPEKKAGQKDTNRESLKKQRKVSELVLDGPVERREVL